MTRWKITRYIIAALFSILIITLSFTFKGIISHYSNLYYSTISPIPIEKQIMGTNYFYTLPSNWQYNEKKFEGKEILYHADFTSADKIIRGISEVWKINIPLFEFLEQSKNSQIEGTQLKDYKLQNIKIGIYNAYVLEYSIRGNNGKYYKAEEYFIPVEDGLFFRISFFVQEDKYNNKVEIVIKSIINTIQVKNT